MKKNPHDPDKYEKADGDSTPPDSLPDKKPKADKLSGAYYYVKADEKTLAERSFIRTTLTIIAFMLQVVCLMIPQGGLGYVSDAYQSYAYVYVMFTIIGFFGVSIWLFVMNAVRYKFAKRIPVERAPHHGFAKRAYFGNELYIAINAVMFVFELSFVCFKFDGCGFGAMLIALGATVAAVLAREVTRRTLKNSELIPAPDDADEPNEQTGNDEQTTIG